jgi:HAD superfamily hydrolase (TIGR01490 family)
VIAHNIPTARTLGAMEAAFFDLDKTIIAKSSVLAFGRPLYREGLISRSAIARSMYAQIVYMLVGADEAKMEKVRESMLRLTKGWDQQHVAEIVRETLEATIQPIIYAEALDLIREHNEAGRKTVIISSSPFEVVAPLAEYLGVDDAIATRAQIDDEGRYTGELEFYAYGAAKAVAIREMAETEGIDLSASYAYSDSVTDIPMLEAVGHPVVVNPDRDLARAAIEREWEVRKFVRPVRLRDRMPVPTTAPTIAASSAAAAFGTGVVLYLMWRRRLSTAR